MLSIVVEIVEDVVVGGLEERSSDRGDVGEDVTSGCSVFSSLYEATSVSRSFVARSERETKSRRTCRRVPNCPLGSRTLRLLLPTNS